MRASSRGHFFSEDAVSAELGTECWTLTKRFLPIQGEDGKERIIDDYRRSHVNSAFASRSYLELQDVDVPGCFGNPFDEPA